MLERNITGTFVSVKLIYFSVLRNLSADSDLCTLKINEREMFLTGLGLLFSCQRYRHQERAYALPGTAQYRTCQNVKENAFLGYTPTNSPAHPPPARRACLTAPMRMLSITSSSGIGTSKKGSRILTSAEMRGMRGATAERGGGDPIVVLASVTQEGHRQHKGVILLVVALVVVLVLIGWIVRLARARPTLDRGVAGVAGVEVERKGESASDRDSERDSDSMACRI